MLIIWRCDAGIRFKVSYCLRPCFVGFCLDRVELIHDGSMWSHGHDTQLTLIPTIQTSIRGKFTYHTRNDTYKTFKRLSIREISGLPYIQGCYQCLNTLDRTPLIKRSDGKVLMIYCSTQTHLHY